MYRQGDVLLIPIRGTKKAKGTPVQAEHGRLILARGEATGHHHSVDARYGALTIDEGVTYLTIEELTAPMVEGVFPVLRHQERAVILAHPEWGETAFAREDCVAIENGVARVSGRFAPFQHQEHAAEAVRPGSYQVVRQREYAGPEHIRAVAD